MDTGYLALIPERYLLPLLERYSVSCNFRITGVPGDPYPGSFLVEIEAPTAELLFGFKSKSIDELRRFIVVMDSGIDEEASILGAERSYYPGNVPRTIRGRGSTQEVQFTVFSGQRETVFLAVPWCYELREVFVRAVEYLLTIE